MTKPQPPQPPKPPVVTVTVIVKAPIETVTPPPGMSAAELLRRAFGSK